MLGVGSQYLFEDRMGFAFEIFGLGSFFLLKMCLFDPSVFVEFDFSLDLFLLLYKKTNALSKVWDSCHVHISGKH